MSESKVMLKRYLKPNSVLNFYNESDIIGVKEKDAVVNTIINKNRF